MELDATRVRHSITNVVHFASRTPFALYRNAVGHRYLDAHPELVRAYSRPRQDAILREVATLAPALPVRRLHVDVAAYRRWVKEARYPLLAYHRSAPEKYLEHELSVELMGGRAAGLLIDVASCRSYFPEIMRRRGFDVIVQDLVYKEGLHGDYLGCNAARMPLADRSVDVMTLHCSFEHFEGSADSDFVRECSRLLAPGGITIIAPLYLHENQITWVDPYFLNRREAVDEAGAVLQPATGYGNRFGRMYSPRTFVERVAGAVRETDLIATLWAIQGEQSVSPSCYIQFALTLEQPRGT